jgi:hypothetical protein
MNAPLRAPFPWFGGKRRVAARVWEALGDTANYVEPFAGSLAVLLARPSTPRVETVNDADGFICNLWRSLRWAPDAVAEHADWPVNESDLTARHRWLNAQRATLTERLEGDPEFYDPKVAAWWCWGLSCWTGDGWCAGDAGRRLPNLDGNGGKGIAGAGRGDLRAWFASLSSRLRNVRVACGDWSRVVAPTVLRNTSGGVRAIFLDPPYSEGDQQYAVGGTGSTVAAAVRAWALENGDDQTLRIVLCGRGSEHADLERRGWRVESWSAKGGYGRGDGKDARHSERLWLSPHCLKSAQRSLFDALGGSR